MHDAPRNREDLPQHVPLAVCFMRRRRACIRVSKPFRMLPGMRVRMIASGVVVMIAMRAAVISMKTAVVIAMTPRVMRAAGLMKQIAKNSQHVNHGDARAKNRAGDID